MALAMAAIKVERRSVAVAILTNGNLEYTQVRQLSSAADKADASAVGFINWTVATFGIASAALERIQNGSEIRRAQLTELLLTTFRDAGIPLWEVSKQELFEAYGMPPLRTRKELRRVVVTIWPILKVQNGDGGILDAVALGLYVQTERLFHQ